MGHWLFKTSRVGQNCYKLIKYLWISITRTSRWLFPLLARLPEFFVDSNSKHGSHLCDKHKYKGVSREKATYARAVLLISCAHPTPPFSAPELFCAWRARSEKRKYWGRECLYTFPYDFSGSGARFSKDPITYRARKAIFNVLYLKKKAVHRH